VPRPRHEAAETGSRLIALPSTSSTRHRRRLPASAARSRPTPSPSPTSPAPSRLDPAGHLASVGRPKRPYNTSVLLDPSGASPRPTARCTFRRQRRSRPWIASRAGDAGEEPVCDMAGVRWADHLLRRALPELYRASRWRAPRSGRALRVQERTGRDHWECCCAPGHRERRLRHRPRAVGGPPASVLRTEHGRGPVGTVIAQAPDTSGHHRRARPRARARSAADPAWQPRPDAYRWLSGRDRPGSPAFALPALVLRRSPCRRSPCRRSPRRSGRRRSGAGLERRYSTGWHEDAVLAGSAPGRSSAGRVDPTPRAARRSTADLLAEALQSTSVRMKPEGLQVRVSGLSGFARPSTRSAAPAGPDTLARFWQRCPARAIVGPMSSSMVTVVSATFSPR